MTTNLADASASTNTESAREPVFLLGDTTSRVKAGQHVLIDVLGGSARRTAVSFDRDSLEFQLSDGAGTTRDKITVSGVGTFSLMNGNISFFAEKDALKAGSVPGRTEDIPRAGVSIAFQARVTGGEHAGELAAGTTAVTITA